MRKTAILLMTILLLAGLYGCTPENETGITDRPDTGEESQADVSPVNSEKEEPSPTLTYEFTPTAGSEIGEPYTDVIQLEGMDETVNYKLVKGRFGYSMPMDFDRFEFEEGEQADYLRSTANENVFMTVLYISDTTAEAEAGARMDVPEGAAAGIEDVTVGAYEAKRVHIVYGNEPDSKIADFYLIEHEGGVYEINHIYFLQAAAASFSLEHMNDTIDFVISTGGGKASYKAEQPGTDAQIIASARAFLEDFCEMEMNEEIPVALMIYDAAKYTALPASGLF